MKIFLILIPFLFVQVFGGDTVTRAQKIPDRCQSRMIRFCLLLSKEGTEGGFKLPPFS